LISIKHLTHSENKTIRKRREPIRLRTANGIIQGTHEVGVYVKDLNDERITAIILKDCPAVISLGLICNEDGFDYVWRNASCPYLQKNGGKKVYCHPHQNVPTIAPATSAGGDSGKAAENSKDDVSTEEFEKAPAKDAGGDAGKEEDAASSNAGGDSGGSSSKAGGDFGGKAEKPKPEKCEICKPIHDLFTHTPKDPECEICNKSKIMRAPCRRKDMIASVTLTKRNGHLNRN
jgi:hypothetical protein